MTSIITPTPAYKPYGAALQMWFCRDPEILMDGPAGTGKTRAILEKAHYNCMKYPGSRILIMRKTRRSMTQSVLVTFETKVCIPGDPILARGGARSHRQSYMYPNGSELVVGGMDDSAKIMSTEYDMICCFEWTEATKDEHEKLQTRLRNGKMPWQQCIVDCNPEAPGHWLNQRALKGLMTRFLSRHQDNPSLLPAYLLKLQALTGVRYLRLFKGVWAAAEGVVYPGWDPAVHVIDRSSLDPAQIKYTVFSQDWGFNDPGTLGVWGVDGDRRMYLIAELFHTKRNIDWWIEQAVPLNKKYTPKFVVCDPSEPGYIEQYQLAGLPATGAMNDIRPGIDLVDERMKVRCVCGKTRYVQTPTCICGKTELADNGRPRIFFLRDSNLIEDEELRNDELPTEAKEEFDLYTNPPRKEGKNSTDVPIDKNNHGMDQMRYAVAGVDYDARKREPTKPQIPVAPNPFRNQNLVRRQQNLP